MNIDVLLSVLECCVQSACLKTKHLQLASSTAESRRHHLGDFWAGASGMSQKFEQSICQGFQDCHNVELLLTSVSFLLDHLVCSSKCLQYTLDVDACLAL